MVKSIEPDQQVKDGDVILIPLMKSTFYNEDKTIARLLTRPLIAGNILNQPFYKRYGYSPHKLNGAEFLDKCAFYCGNSPEYTAAELEMIIRCLKC